MKFFQCYLFVKMFIILFPAFCVVLRTSNGIKCEMRAFVEGRVQCIFHDRGVNAEGFVFPINRENKKKVIVDPWRYSTGLDSNKTFFDGESEDEFKEFVHTLFPDVRWCGEKGGYAALSHEDLVYYVRTDKCCKEHDQCDSIIRSKHSENNITNMGLMSRFHCNCEKQFYQCLKTINRGQANRIGFTYFTLLGPQCFREDYSAIECKRKKAERCVEYKYARNQSKTYQWFDLPIY